MLLSSSIEIPKYRGLCMFSRAFSFLLLVNFQKFFCCMIVWFRYELIPSCFSCYNHNISVFSDIFHYFSKNCVIHQLKKIFFKIIFCFFFRPVFVSIYDFNEAFWLNLMILCTFFNTYPLYNDCFSCKIKN